MAKAEIGFERTLDDGSVRQVYVAHNGGKYRFFTRAQRYDNWEAESEPPIEDWLELLDCVRRRVARRKLMPEEESRVLACIRSRFPKHEF